MERYRNVGRDSNVEGFEIGINYIAVKFKGKSRIYTYSNARAGKRHVDKMKVLANKGRGLNGYIKNYVNKLYD